MDLHAYMGLAGVYFSGDEATVHLIFRILLKVEGQPLHTTMPLKVIQSF